MMLYHNEGVNQEALAEQLHINKVTVARALKKIEN
jgi:DNA-binding transcriptional regulator LsrR (DeoR family)